MPLSEIRCSRCGSQEVMEFKPGRYVCCACEAIFEYIDPNRSEVAVAPQFCEEGCGNPIKYRCALCGRMVCDGHGGKAKDMLGVSCTTVSELQQAWCHSCWEAMSSEDVVGYAALALKDSDPSVRESATWALYRIGPPAFHYLIQALGDRDPSVRQSAANALGKIGDPSAVPYLVQALGDSFFYVRQSATSALGQIGDPSAVPYLVQALGDRDPSVRLSAFWALRWIGPPAFHYLIQALGHSNPYVRTYAAEVLGEIGDSSAIPHLIWALRDYHQGVRQSVAQALGKLGPPAVPNLIEALRDNSYQVRKSAALILERIGDPRGVQAVAKARRRWFKGIW